MQRFSRAINGELSAGHARQIEFFVIHINTDRSRTPGTCGCYDTKSHSATTPNRNRVVCGYTSTCDGMKSDGKRFHQAQLFQGQLSGIQFFSRQHNEFGKGAIPLHTESLVELASVPTATPARRALAATGIWGDRYVRASRQYGLASEVLNDGRRYFMS